MAMDPERHDVEAQRHHIRSRLDRAVHLFMTERPQVVVPQPPPEIPPTSEAPKDSPLRLFGPNVGDYAQDIGATISPSDITAWIDKDAANVPVTTLPLFVLINRHKTQLLPAPSGTTPGQSAIPLPPPTHLLSLACDCIALHARIDLYSLSERIIDNNAHTPPAVVNSGAPRPRGWMLASDTISQGFDVPLLLPVVLDDAWRRPLTLALVIEALDENYAPLREPNALSVELHTEHKGAWHVHASAMRAFISPYELAMHELFGLAPHSDQTTVAGDADKSTDPNTSNMLDLNKSLIDAALLANLDSEGECPICMSQPSVTLLFPCTHALCLECAVRVRDSVQKSRAHDLQQGRAPRSHYACPICRGSIESMVSLAVQ